ELAVAIDTLDEIEGVSYHAPGVEAARERAQSRGGPRSSSPPPPEVAVRAPPKPVSAPPAPPPPPVLATAAPPRRAATPTPAELAAPVPNRPDEPLHLPRRRISPATIGAAAAALLVGFGAVAILSSGSKSGTTPTTTEARTAAPAETPKP